MKLTALFSSLFLTTFAAGEAIHLVNCNGGPQPISMVAVSAPCILVASTCPHILATVLRGRP